VHPGGTRDGGNAGWIAAGGVPVDGPRRIQAVDQRTQFRYEACRRPADFFHTHDEGANPGTTSEGGQGEVEPY
jgi:hypothetical protein